MVFLLKDDSLKTKSELIMNGVRIDDKRIGIIEMFWQDQGVKECFSRRNEFQLTDSASFFLDNARRITSDDFEPTDMVCFPFLIILVLKSIFKGYFDVEESDSWH